jgi:hypothetical protein
MTKKLDNFYIRKNNRVENRCKSCIKEINKNRKEEIRNYKKEYYSRNKELINLKIQNLNADDKEKIRNSKKRHYENNKSKYKEYYKNNKEKRRDYHKEKMNNDIVYKLKHGFNRRLNKSLKRGKFIKSNSIPFLESIGCSFEDFKLYLESKFEYWMKWENYGLYNGELNYGWDIDHIIPSSSAKTEEDIIRLNHYTNLQPLCSKLNRDIKKWY